MKKLLIGLLMLVCISAHAAIVTYNYTGPKGQVMISGGLLFLKGCENGCFGEIDIDFIPERYVTISNPIEIFIVLEALQGSMCPSGCHA